MPKFPENMLYLKPGLLLLLFTTVCRQESSYSFRKIPRVPQVSSILSIHSIDTFSLPPPTVFVLIKCPVDECNVFSILFILFVHLAL